MNERIKELYIQTAYETADGKEWAIGGMENAERFAELIVRECANIVTDAVDHREPASTYADKIRQHFGVEE
jgi:hypothetical protein